MQVARIVAVSAIMLAVTVLSGCTAGPGRIRRESAEPLPGRLIEPDEPSVVAPTNTGQAWWKRPSVAAAPGPNSSSARPQQSADAVLTSGAPAGTRRRWFQGWSLAPNEIAANLKAGLGGSPSPSVSAAGGGSAGRRQSPSLVTQTRATVDASTLPNVPSTEAPKSPIVRASRLSSKPVESLPISIALRLPPRSDDDDRLASHEAPLPEPEAEQQPIAAGTIMRARPDPTPTEEPSRLASSNGFPDPVLPPDLDDLDRLLDHTQNGEAVPTIAQEVPPDPDLDERFQGRRRLSELPPSSTTTLTMKGKGPRPIGLPARLPDATYPEDRTRSGTLMGRETADPEPSRPQATANPGMPARRRGVLSGVADAIGGLMRREPGNVAEPR